MIIMETTCMWHLSCSNQSSVLGSLNVLSVIIPEKNKSVAASLPLDRKSLLQPLVWLRGIFCRGGAGEHLPAWCRIEGHGKQQGVSGDFGRGEKGNGAASGSLSLLLCGFSAQPRMQTHQPARGIPITHSTLQLEKAVPHRASNSLGTDESVREKTICICHFLSAGPAFSWVWHRSPCSDRSRTRHRRGQLLLQHLGRAALPELVTFILVPEVLNPNTPLRTLGACYRNMGSGVILNRSYLILQDRVVPCCLMVNVSSVCLAGLMPSWCIQVLVLVLEALALASPAW